MASGTSFALPSPRPILPAPSPTTTSAEKENRRPPLTTLATRLIATTLSSNSLACCCLSATFFSLELQSGFTSRFGKCLYFSMIKITVPIKNDGCDLILERFLSQLRTQRLGTLDVRRLLRGERRNRNQRFAGSIVDDLS